MESKKSVHMRHTKAPKKTKIKEGGRLVVSEALVKSGVTNLVPKIHVKRGDMVMLMNGPKKDDKKRSKEDTNSLAERNAFKGTIGKVIAVMPKEGKVIIEGVNMMTNYVRPKQGMRSEAGIVRKEAPVYASRVMLYSPDKKRPIRSEKRKEHGL
ncbi:MAG: 50S ribosomal protein L24 [Candidatus Obscuribacterales bacterium]|jgi:large subunit ribosomal protein L24|nr:50S ribosomal protein L24 [Candidatus Obscuribacterales bacterium]